MIYEQRVYTAAPGRMADLQNRFRTLTLPVFDRLGIRTLGFMTPIIGPSSNDLIYYFVWESLAERETKMAAFARDPEWIAGRTASEQNGPLASNISTQLLQPTAFARTSAFYDKE